MLYSEALKHKMERKFEVRDYNPTQKLCGQISLKSIHRYSRNCLYKTILKCLGLYAWQTIQGIAIQLKRWQCSKQILKFLDCSLLLSLVNHNFVDLRFTKTALDPVEQPPNTARSRVNSSFLKTHYLAFPGQTHLSSVRPTSEPRFEYLGQDYLEYLMSKSQVLEWFEKLHSWDFLNCWISLILYFSEIYFSSNINFKQKRQVAQCAELHFII